MSEHVGLNTDPMTKQEKDLSALSGLGDGSAKSAALVPSTRSLYDGIASLTLSTAQRTILLAPTPTEELEVLPTGEVYMAQVFFRRRLNEAFGPGAWGVRPIGQVAMRDNILMREYALFVNGAFVGQAAGEADYIPNNPRMSYATATEACKSNAIMRLCKDLGIASECWNRRFTAKFKSTHCVLVYRTKHAKRPYQWRLKDAEPFDDEGQTPTNPSTVNATASASPTPSTEGRFILSKYDGKCYGCETPISKGHSVWYVAGQKGVLCKACANTPAPENETSVETEVNF